MREGKITGLLRSIKGPLEISSYEFKVKLEHVFLYRIAVYVQTS